MIIKNLYEQWWLLSHRKANTGFSHREKKEDLEEIKLGLQTAPAGRSLPTPPMYPVRRPL